MKVAEPSDELGVTLVGLGTVQFGFTERMNLSRVDDADSDLVLDQKGRQGLAIAAGRFQTDVRWRERAQPGEACFEAHGGIREDLGLILAVNPSGNVKFGVGAIDSDRDEWG